MATPRTLVAVSKILVVPFDGVQSRAGSEVASQAIVVKPWGSETLALAGTTAAAIWRPRGASALRSDLAAGGTGLVVRA